MIMIKMRLWAVAIAGLFATTAFAQEGISFEQGTWQEILDKAKAENKPVFLDAYASWCGPCKWMAKEVFTKKEAGEYYNENFICAKIDMEKGEGIKLAEEYGVKAYPTLLYVLPDGMLAYKAVGAKEAEAFIETGKRAKDPAMQLESLHDKYNKGERSLDFMSDYLFVLADGYADYNDIAEEFFETHQEELLTKQGAELLVKYLTATEGSSFDLLVNNRSKLSELVGEKEVSDKLFQLYTKSYLNTREKTEEGYAIDFDTFEKALEAIKNSSFERAKELELKAYMFYYKSTGDKEKYMISVDAYVSNINPESWQEYNQYAWYAYENIDNSEILQKAVRWAKKSISLEDNYYNEDTLAALLFKLKKYDEAEQAANKAIALAQQAGDEAKETKELLKKIKEAQK